MLSRIVFRAAYKGYLAAWRSRAWVEQRRKLAAKRTELLEYAFTARDEAVWTLDVVSAFSGWRSRACERRRLRALEEMQQWKGHFVLMKKNVKRVETLTEGALYLNLEVARSVWAWNEKTRKQRILFGTMAKTKLIEHKRRMQENWEQALLEHSVELHKANVTSRCIRVWAVKLRMHNNHLLR